MGFPDDADLGLKAEINVGTWADITGDTRTDQPVTITRGRSDYAQQVDPTKVAVKIRNPNGDYSPRNPSGAYYGKIGRNTPLRASIAAGSCWLGIPPSGSDIRASTPSAGALNITGDLDLRFDIAISDYNSVVGATELGGKWGSTGQQSWHAYTFAGTVRFGWTTDGSTELSAAAPLGPAELRPRIVLRIVLDVDNGAGSHVVRFYIGTSVSGTTWTQIGGDNVVAGTTATFSSTVAVEIGDVTSTPYAHVPARLFAAQIRNGINGTVVANPDFTILAPGTTTFTDSASRAWTVNSTSGVTNRMVRGTGEVPSWPQRTGTSGRLVTASLEAAGIRRRLGQGASPLDSTLRRRIVTDPNLVAYWPMEDGSAAVQAYSPLPGVNPMATTGLSFASDDSLAGSSALPVLGATASVRGNVPAAASGQWLAQLVFKIDTAPAGDANAQFILINTTGGQWRIGVGATALHMTFTQPDGTVALNSNSAPTFFFGAWTRLFLKAQQSGSDINYFFEWISIGVDAQGGGGTISSATAGRVTSVTGTYGSLLQGMSLGHVSVFSAYSTTVYDASDTGFAGEDGYTRLIRVTGEEGVPLIAPYGTGGMEQMGPQRPDTLLNLAQQAADADEGAILYEPRDAISLAIRPRRSLYNQPVALTLDWAQQQVAPPLEPTDDDQATRNDITVQRTGGSSGRATLVSGPMSTADPLAGGVGRYTDSATENLYTDDQPLPHAQWRLHIGTFDGMRYPVVTVFLQRCPELIDQAREVDIGDRIQILNPPSWLPPGTVDLLVQGVTEVLGVRTWTISFNCSPAGPWNVAILDDPVLGRLDTDGSQLAAGVTATATTLSVAVTAGPLWTTDPNDYPFDLGVGGEVVTARAAGAPIDLIDGTFESGVTGWTATSSTFQASAQHARSGTLSGLLTVTGAPTSAFARPDSTHYAPVTVGTSYRCTLWVYAPVLSVASVSVTIDWLDASKAFLSAVGSSAVALPAGVWTLLTLTATAPASAAYLRSGPTLGSSPATGAQIHVDDMATVPTSTYTASPQSIAVIRSVNSVVKAQAAATDVRLAQPLVLAL